MSSLDLLLGFMNQSREVTRAPLYKLENAELAAMIDPEVRESEGPWFFSQAQVMGARRSFAERFGGGDAPRELHLLMKRVMHTRSIAQLIRAVPADVSQHGWGAVKGGKRAKGEGAKLFRSLLRAVRSGKPGRVDSALTLYEQWLGTVQIPEPAMDWSVPDTWVEIGLQAGPRGVFSETRSVGRKVASFYMGPEQECAGGLVYFSGPVDLGNVEDFNRLMLGKAPMSRSVAGILSNGLGIHIEGAVSAFLIPPTWNLGRNHSGQVASWTDGAGTWVATLRGPEKVAKAENGRFLKFVHSIRVGSRDAVLAWLPDEPEEPLNPFFGSARKSVALWTTKEHLWILRFHDSSQSPEHLLRTRETAKALQWEGEEPGTMIAPADSEHVTWEPYPVLLDCAGAWVCHEEGGGLLAVLTRIERCDPERWMDCANALVGIAGAPLWTEEQWKSWQTTIQTDLGQVLFVGDDSSL
ncbi:MAG: hypothetical protein P1V35_17925 [Planctomycetota bacterium]|nr:hypothetical protein [Planctomycetota bacterium]